MPWKEARIAIRDELPSCTATATPTEARESFVVWLFAYCDDHIASVSEPTLLSTCKECMEQTRPWRRAAQPFDCRQNPSPA